MKFFSLLAVLALVNWTSISQTVQDDRWFIALSKKLRAAPAISAVPLLPMLMSLLIPLSVVVFLILLILELYQGTFFENLLFFVNVPILLYSLGRGDFISDVNKYISTASRGDSVAAAQVIDSIGGRAGKDFQDTDTKDWKSLHGQALKATSYRGFEHTFAVLFWFLIAQGVGALMYRLSVIYREQTEAGSIEATLVDRWLWLIEYPVVRLMGLTWAFVGNFETCPIKESLMDTESASIDVLNNCLRGALSASTDFTQQETVSPATQSKKKSKTQTKVSAAEEMEAEDLMEDLVGVRLGPQAEPAYSFALVKSSVPLYVRSLLFWVGAVAFATMFL